MKKLILISSACLALSGCTKQPAASYSTDRDSVAVGDTVVFTNTSEHADSFEWSFGDGTISTEKNPSHVYLSPGLYQVNMAAFSKKQKKISRTTPLVITVTVTPPPPPQPLNLNFQKACLSYYGTWNNGYYYHKFRVWLMDDEVSFANDALKGTGNAMWVYLISAYKDLSEGEYGSGAPDIEEYSVVNEVAYFDYDFQNNIGATLTCSTISVTVSKSDSLYTFDMKGTVTDGRPLKVYYKGPVTKFDYSKLNKP